MSEHKELDEDSWSEPGGHINFAALMGYNGDPDEKMPGLPWTWREWTVTETDELHRRYSIPTLAERAAKMGRETAQRHNEAIWAALGIG